MHRCPNCGHEFDKNVKKVKPDYPAELDNPAFRHVYEEEWLPYRQLKKKPLLKKSVDVQLTQLAPFGSQWAVARIRDAIANGWMGLIFDEDRRRLAAETEEEDDGLARLTAERRAQDPWA